MPNKKRIQATYLVQICLHEFKDDIDVFEFFGRGWQHDMLDLNYVCIKISHEKRKHRLTIFKIVWTTEIWAHWAIADFDQNLLGSGLR